VQVRLLFSPYLNQFDLLRVIVCPISEIMRIRRTFSAENYHCGSSCRIKAFSFSLSPFVERGYPMFRTALGLGFVAIVLAAAGCQMCCHPYDRSGPVFSDDGCPSSTHSRAGSFFAGSPQPSVLPTKNQIQDESASPSPVPDQAKRRGHSISYVMAGDRVPGERVQGPLLGRAQPGDVPGSERIVSVTDRVVGPSADSSQAAEDSSPASSKPLSANGWTARRPTTEVLR